MRQALFASADKTPPDCHTYFGQGLLRAAAALAVAPAAGTGHDPARRRHLPLAAGAHGVGVAASPRDEMLEVEALQLLQRDREIEKTIQDPDLPARQLDDG